MQTEPSEAASRLIALTTGVWASSLTSSSSCLAFSCFRNCWTLINASNITSGSRLCGSNCCWELCPYDPVLRIVGRTSPYNQSWNGSALKAFDQLIKRYRLDSLMTVTSCGRPMLSMVYRFDIPSVLQCRVTACGAFKYPNSRQTSVATNHNVPSGSTNTRIFWFVAGNTNAWISRPYLRSTMPASTTPRCHRQR